MWHNFLGKLLTTIVDLLIVFPYFSKVGNTEDIHHSLKHFVEVQPTLAESSFAEEKSGVLPRQQLAWQFFDSYSIFLGGAVAYKRLHLFCGVLPFLITMQWNISKGLV